MKRFLTIIALIFIATWVNIPSALAASDMMHITFKGGVRQDLKMNRGASEIMRITMDEEQGGDRLVVTYTDNTHQVFMLKNKVATIIRVSLGKGMKQGAPAPKPAPALTEESRAAGAAFDEMSYDFKLGKVWTVTEHCSGMTWKGTWIRRGKSNIFDAKWKSRDGKSLTSVLAVVGVADGKVKLFREDKKGYYEASISYDHTRLTNGWATWYKPHCSPWNAVID